MANGISLHVGLNLIDPEHYAGWSGKLRACQADAEDMRAIATAQGYSTTLLLTADATRAAVTASIRTAAESLQPGDIFFLTYSGHGGQLPDTNQEEDDKMDETWCLYDGHLVDDALYELFGRFKAGVRILILSDSCHSGTISKEQLDKLNRASSDLRQFDPVTGLRVWPLFRGMPLDVMTQTYLENRATYDRELAQIDPEARAKISATVRLISGCQDDQLSSDGIFNGVFTSRLKRVWADGKFEGNYASFHEAIAARMPEIQKPNHDVYGAPNPAFDAQRPFTI